MNKNRFIEEDEHLKAYDLKLIKRLFMELKPYMTYVVISFLFLLIIALFSLVGPYLIKVAIDDYIVNGDYAGLNFIVLIYFVVIILKSLAEYGRIYIYQYVGQSAMYSLRVKVFSHVQNLKISFFDKNPVGRVMTRVTNDIEGLNDLFSAGVITIFGDLLTLIGIVIVLFYLDFRLALITFSVIPLLIAITYVFRKHLRSSYRATREKTAKLNSFLQENINGMKIVQLFTREKVREGDFIRINSDYKNAFFRTITAYSLFFPTIELLTSISIALIIYYGGGKVIQDALTMGVLVAFIEYLRKFFIPIRDMTEKYNILQSAMSAAERIYKLLETETEEDTDSVVPAGERLKGGIEFKNVWFAYEGEEYVLKDISFNIEPGEKIAIVGATGAGKTSIVNLLSAFYEINKGEITIDGTDIYSYSKNELRGNIGIVLQDAFIFSGSIKENITLRNQDISMDEVVSAAKNAYADRFIEKLPDKYDETVGEKGALLSAGQKQLVSFSRVLIYDPSILILDEATSTVDTETEYLIQKATEKLMEGRTSIVIAHRLSTIKNVDRIFVFHKGELVETGTHEDLYKRKGIYRRLYELQYESLKQAE